MVREDNPPRKSGGGVNDYGYINVRVRVMSNALLDRAGLERLLGAESLDAFVSLLSSTDYAPDISASEQKSAKGMGRAVVIEEGLKQNFSRTLAKLCSLVGGKPAELVNIILSHWDIFNLKTIIRGKHTDLPPPRIIQLLFFVGTLERDYLEGLAKRQDVEGVIDALADSRPQMVLQLREEFDAYLAGRNLMDLELALEKWYHQQALKWCGHIGEASRLVRKFLRAEIDIVNAMTCLRLARVDIEAAKAQRFYIPGGIKIKQRDFKDLIAMDGIEDILSWLEQKLPAVTDGLPQRLELFKERDDVSLFERLFEINLMRQLRLPAIGDPMGFNILISYLRLKYNELINLRIILRAVEFGLPGDMMRQELIFAQ